MKTLALRTENIDTMQVFRMIGYILPAIIPSMSLVRICISFRDQRLMYKNPCESLSV